MAHRYYSRGIVWGIILIVIGVLIIADNFFHVSIPISTVIISLILIALGIQIMFGGFRGRYFSHGYGYQTIKYEAGSGDRHYDLNFKGMTLDLSEMSLKGGTVKIDITGSFGGGAVLLNPELPVRIEAGASFGGVTFPDGNVIGFGQGSYQNQAFNQDMPHLLIKVDISFGGLRFVTSKDDIHDWHRMRHEWREERRKWKRRYREGIEGISELNGRPLKVPDLLNFQDGIELFVR